MQYDPIKAVLGQFFNKKTWLRKLFYRLLNLLLLRSWHIRSELKNTLRPLLLNKQEAKALDAGSGFGQYMWVMAKTSSKLRVDGIEIKQEQVDDCNAFFEKAKLHNAKVEYGDLLSWKKPDTYQLILSVDVMEHIEDDVKVFENFYASLQNGGTLLISTPSDQGGSGVEHEHDSSFIEEHVRDGYGVQEIHDKLSKAGFSKILVKFTYGKPGKISWLLSMKYPIQLLGVSKAFFLILPLYYLPIFPLCALLNFWDVKAHHNSGTGLLIKAIKHH